MKIASYLNRLSEKSLVIFLFHGVIKQHAHQVRNYNRKHILEHEFIELVQSLKKIGYPLGIDQVVTMVNMEQQFPDRSFVISFDDGFENNYSVAAPILDEFNIPAVFYITSGFVDDNYMSWVDQADYAIEHSKQKKIKVSFLEHEHDISSTENKIGFLEDFRVLMKNNKEFFLHKEQFIQEIFAACQVGQVMSSLDPIDLKMNWDQVKSLNNNNLFTVGGHTHTHPVMSYLSQQALEKEIGMNLSKIAVATKEQPKHFSYPEGSEYSYNSNVINILKDKGIVCSPTAIDGINNVRSDLFGLKRVTVI